CNTCHDRLGTDTLSHYNRANARLGMDALRVPPGDAAILAAYDAKSGISSFNAANRTCSNVSCHGGQTTPDWQAAAGAIDVVNACTSCHFSGTTQYNSYNSGKHEVHIAQFGRSSTTCKQCHDATKVNVTGHFQNLATYAFEQSPAATILPAVGYSRSRSTCNPACHGKERW
ncbi:MAG: CxxxxCH/CxxCH domain-containing protein, partial [Deltaproteobacteria bacterium]|nr:CxxxxCH/CxxCH domain-containing protein [Deltaproteobacteria bacterium]